MIFFQHVTQGIRLTAFFVAILTLAFADTVAAQISESDTTQTQATVSTQTSSWQFEITPYFLAAGLNGTVGVGPVAADIDLSFGDILDNLDFGFMGLFEVRKSGWMLTLVDCQVSFQILHTHNGAPISDALTWA